MGAFNLEVMKARLESSRLNLMMFSKTETCTVIINTVCDVIFQIHSRIEECRLHLFPSFIRQFSEVELQQASQQLESEFKLMSEQLMSAFEDNEIKGHVCLIVNSLKTNYRLALTELCELIKETYLIANNEEPGIYCTMS